MDLVEAVRQIESKYGSVMNAPDKDVQWLQKIAKPYYGEIHKAPKMSGGMNAKQRGKQLSEAFAKLDTASMTLKEIAALFNADDELTFNGEFTFANQNVYLALKQRGLPYKKTRIGRPKQ